MITATITEPTTKTEHHRSPPQFAALTPRDAATSDPVSAALIAYVTQVHQASASVARQQIDELGRIAHSDLQLLDVVGLGNAS